MAYDTILFDVDGTLCDPGASMIESARYALSEMGIHENDDAALRRFVGPPLEHTFRDYYKFDEAKTKKAAELFRYKLQRDGIQLYTAYPGITELLKSLYVAKKTVAIVTSKLERIAKAALESTELLKYFEVVGAQLPEVVVEKEVILARVLKQLHTSDRSKIVMIGDRKHDIEAANIHGIDSIGVLWGYGSKEEFQLEDATHIVADTDELSSLLEKS